MKRKHGSDSGSDSAADSAADSGSDFQPSPTPAPVNKKPNVKPDIKPDIKPKVTKSPTKRASPSKAGGSGKLPPGSKAALASLIVQRGLASLPSHAECAEIVSRAALYCQPSLLGSESLQCCETGCRQTAASEGQLTTSDGHDACASAQSAGSAQGRAQEAAEVGGDSGIGHRRRRVQTAPETYWHRPIRLFKCSQLNSQRVKRQA